MRYLYWYYSTVLHYLAPTYQTLMFKSLHRPTISQDVPQHARIRVFQSPLSDHHTVRAVLHYIVPSFCPFLDAFSLHVPNCAKIVSYHFDGMFGALKLHYSKIFLITLLFLFVYSSSSVQYSTTLCPIIFQL